MVADVQGAVAFRTRQNPGRAVLLTFAVAATLAILVLASLHDVAATLDRPIHTREFWMKFALDPRIYVYPLVLVGAIAWAWLRTKYERLIIGPHGIRYISPLGGMLPLFQGLDEAWSLSWPEIQRVELQVQSAGLGKRLYWLVVNPDQPTKRRIDIPLKWEQVPSLPHSKAEVNARDEQAVRAAIMASPLVRAMRHFGAEVTERPGLISQSKGYDIAQDRHLMAAVIVLIGLLLYFLGDTFIVWPYMALQNVPVWPYLIVGPLGLWIGLKLGNRAPRAERTLISILLAGAMCGACYPLMLRLNALTAVSNNSYQYTQMGRGYFKPPDPTMPYIYFDNEPAYWGSFRNGSTHEFRVVKGTLGFYEVDTGRVQEETRAWWATQKFR